MSNHRILVGALSGWQHGDRRDRCVDTWIPDLRKLGHDAVFLLGVPNLSRPERRGDVLVLPCPDDYPSLPQRTRWFCQWALGIEGWDYLFKCDDDTYVAAYRLATYDLAGRDYVGAEWTPGVAYGSGGAGYFLSRRAAAVVAEKLTPATGAEDALVGQVLREAGIALSVEPRLIPFGSSERRPKPDNDIITLHGVDANVFYASHCELVSAGQSPRVPLMRSGVMLDGLKLFARQLPCEGRAVEIGSFAGESTAAFAEHGLTVDAIDPWDESARDQLLAGSRRSGERQVFSMADVEAAFDQRLSAFGGRVRKRKGYDHQFVNDYEDRSLDLVYIDAVHTREEVLDAIDRWWPKLKSGGVMAGHDFATYFPGVAQAVRERFGELERVFADTTWMVTKRPPATDPAKPKVALLFLTRNNLTQPQLWAEWLRGHEDQFAVFVHAKHRDQVTDEILRGRIIDEYVETVHSAHYPHHAVTKAQIALLRAGIADPAARKLAFVSESTIPIAPADEVYECLLADNRSWIDDDGFWPQRFAGLRVGSIPAEHFRKAANWLVLNRAHAWRCIEAEAEFVDAFAGVYGADEHYFPTVLSLGGVDFGTEVRSQCATYVDWKRGGPFVFESLSENELVDARRAGQVFLRKAPASCDISTLR